LRVLEFRWTDELVQILFSTTPDVAPELIAARAKGRLDHALRTAGIEMPFSRKVAIRAIGENTHQDVEAYLERQVGKERFADPRFAKRMQDLAVFDAQVDLSQPAETARGRYWYNLHLVLVVSQHSRIDNATVLREWRDAFGRIAAKKRHAVSRLAIMPNHLHAALRGQPGESPLEIVAAYQNNLAYMTQQRRIWSPGFYVGTFGEYSMQAVRNRVTDGQLEGE
jgi:REP element-mobilizing transposase RayT